MTIQKIPQRLFISTLSCSLLFICGLLSGTSSALAMPHAQNKQDPTRPASVSVQQHSLERVPDPKYILTAIFSRNNKHYGVVNGNVVQLGDAIADMHVIQITSTKIIMQNLSTQDETILALSSAANVKKQVNQ